MSQLLSPIGLLLLAMLLIALALYWRRRGLLVVGTGLTLLAIAGMTPWVANQLVVMVESRADNGSEGCAELELIVLLSGGLDYPPRSPEDFAALTEESLLRSFHFASRAYAEPSELPLLVAGGGPFQISESAVMAGLLERLAPTLAPILLETESRSTWESAEQLARTLPPPRSIALASSALHLPRAARAFSAAGYTVCRWPLQRRAMVVGGIGAWTPQSSALRKTEAALHEIVGDWAYRWRSGG